MKNAPLTILLFLFFAITLSAQYDISGELKKWHKVTLTFEGPNTSETAATNPFTDYRLNVTFTKDNKSYLVPGFYAADGTAANSSAASGNKWRVHFCPDETGTWNFTVSFRTGDNVAIDEAQNAGSATGFDGVNGNFNIVPTDKTGRDHRGKGRLRYVGEHFLQFEETGEYFLKIGADAPENFLAYDDFDNTPDYGNRRKSWEPHLPDWNNGDPTWQNTKGKEIIGALNYLSEQGQNVFSFLTMNINGDDKNVFPYIGDDYQDRTRFDCSKLDQWEVVFEHADKMGLYLHFKTQETENDQLLDGGALGLERKMYYRELIARFGHHLALNWNVGEENTNTTQQRKDFAQYFYDNDPYRHHVVIHTYPGQQNQVYNELTGNQSKYTGPSIQTGWSNVHQSTLNWVESSAASGKKWVVANDEQGNANTGVPHDDYSGSPSQNDIRKSVLWGNLMAGGAGVEYYFGYQLPHSDLTCQDFRSRSNMWTFNRIAHEFFRENIKFWEMSNRNDLVGNTNNNNSKFCLADPGTTYLVYLRDGGSTNIDLQSFDYSFTVKWFDPRNGGFLQNGTLSTIAGPGAVNTGGPPGNPDQDWAILITVDSIACSPAGTPCNDGDDSTFNDVEDGDCNCTGTPCPPAGTACDDGNPDTENDMEDGFCNCIGTIVPGDSIFLWYEAECADFGNLWTENSRPDASNEAYLSPPDNTSLNTAPANPEDHVRFTFEVDTSGDYWVYARVLSLNDDGNSFWVRANEGEWQRWNKVNEEEYGDFFQWRQVKNWINGNNSELVIFNLEEGENTIVFAWREPNTLLDKVFISSIDSLPSGLGDPDLTCDNTPTSIHALPDLVEELTLLPNPATDQFSIRYQFDEKVPQMVTVQLMNTLGQPIRQWTFSHQVAGLVQFPIAEIPVGHYSVRLKINGTWIIRPMIKIE